MSNIQSKQDVLYLRESGKILKETKEILKNSIKVGISLKELDDIANKNIIKNNAIPSFLGYNGFPGSICTSVNDVMIHGIPNKYVLKEGDVLSVDIGVYKNGFHTDSAFTVGVGKLTPTNKLLLDTTKECLDKALAEIKDGVALSVIGKAIETHANGRGFHLNIDYSGHGVGKSLHEEPFIFNVEKSPYQNFKLKEGMVVAIEPMLSIGTEKVFIDPIDNWSVRTTNGRNAAHEEHTIIILKDGIEILT